MEIKTKLRYARTSHQKAALVVDIVRGKNVNDAIKTLTFLDKKVGKMVKKLLDSAISIAEKKEVIDIDNLYIKEIYVNKGPMLKRFMPRAKGRATPIRKRMSHINLTLDER